MNERRTILIVDDCPKMRDAVTRCCTRPEDTVIEAANGLQAVECFRQHHPDWTVMDIQMPEMNGLVATREILRQYKEARVVILTQHDGPLYLEEARAAGACAFVPKDNLLLLTSIIEERASVPMVLPSNTGEASDVSRMSERPSKPQP